MTPKLAVYIMTSGLHNVYVDGKMVWSIHVYSLHDKRTLATHLNLMRKKYGALTTYRQKSPRQAWEYTNKRPWPQLKEDVPLPMHMTGDDKMAQEWKYRGIW